MSRVFRTKRMRMTAWLLSAAVCIGSMDINMLTVQAAQEGNLYAEDNTEITEDTVPEADSSATDETVVENPDTAGQTQSEQGTVPEGAPQIENHEESAEVYSTPDVTESDEPVAQADEGDGGETTPTGPLRVDVSGIVVKGKTYDGSPVVASGTLKAVVPKEISVSGREEDVTAQVSFMYSVSGTKEDGSAYNHPESNVPNGNIIDGMPKDAGTYTLTIKVDDPDYVGALGVQFKISKRRITIKVNDKQKRIGDDVPDFDNAKEDTDYTVSNLVSGEKLITPPKLACEITEETKDTPGAYLITASDADAGQNYNIEYQTGTLTVTNKVKVDISGVTISDKVYDKKPIVFDRNNVKVTDPTSGETVTDKVTLQCSIVGKQKDGMLYLWDDNSDNDLDDNDNPDDGSNSSKKTELPSKAGDYTLIVAVTSLKYRGELRVEFSITKKPITLKADDLEIKQGDKIPTAFTYTKEGLLDGDTITKEPLYTCNISNTEKTGKYTITPRDAAATGSNYKITYVPGTLTVLEKDRITISGITTTPSPKVYDGTPVVCNTDNLKVVLNQSGVENTDITDKVEFEYSIEGVMANGIFVWKHCEWYAQCGRRIYDYRDRNLQTGGD